MNKKEEIYKFFAENAKLERQAAIRRVIKEFVVTETTATTYYQAWRKDFMKPIPKPINFTNNAIKVSVENAVTDETTVALEDKVISTEELKEELVSKAPEEIKLIPIMFQGPVFTFGINSEGVKIIDGASEIITEDIIQEQQAALKIFNDLYGNQIKGRG